MRRALLICLMLLLPLQWSWAAVSGICRHEPTSQTPHLGHHDHRHVDADLATGDGAPGADHADCAACHLAFADKLCHDADHERDVERAAEVWCMGSPPRHVSHIPALPERPDRATS